MLVLELGILLIIVSLIFYSSNILYNSFLGYFGPTNITYYGNYSNPNETLARAVPIETDTEQFLPSDEGVKKREAPRRTREFWLSMNKP